MRNGQGTAPDARLGVWTRKMLSLLLAVCMAVSLCPATALATADDGAAGGNADERQNAEVAETANTGRAATADDAQTQIDAWVPTKDVQGGAVGEDGTTSAETTVTVTTYSSFQATENHEGPDGIITVRESQQENTPSGRLLAEFIGGRPYPKATKVDGVQIPAGSYAMKLTWTKNGFANPAYSLTRAVAADSDNRSVCHVDCSLNSIFGDADREGTYVFHMTLLGEGGQEALGVTFQEFTISDSAFTRTWIDNPTRDEGDPYTYLTGLFAESAVLSSKDISAGEGSAAASTLGMLQDAAAGGSLAAAWQIQIVNGTYLPDTTLFNAVNSVQIDLSAGADGTGAALAAADTFSLVSLVKGESHAVELTRTAQETTEDGSTVYTFTGTVADGTPVTATLTVPAAGAPGNPTLKFGTEGLGGSLGAFGIALPSAKGTYTVQPSAANGTISPADAIVRPVDTDAVFTLSPLGGYVLDPKPIVRINGTQATEGASTYTISGNTLTLKGRAAGTTTQLAVEFRPYEAEPGPGGEVLAKMDMQISGAGDAAAINNSTIAATFQQVQQVEGADVAVPQTVTGSTPQLKDVQAGTAVQLNFQKLADGYVVRGVRVGDTLANAQQATLMTVVGSTFTVSAMGTGTQFVVVEYERGVQPPIQKVTHVVRGLAGEGGSVSGSSETGVTHGNAFTSTVQADANYVISSVKLYNGLLGAMPGAGDVAATDLTNAVAGKNLTSYDVLIGSVVADVTVVATFQRGPVSVNVAQVAGGRVWLQSAGADALPPYEVPYGTDATFAFNVQDDYAFDGVWQGSKKLSLAELGIVPGATSGTFTLRNLTGSTTLTPVFVPKQMPDPETYVFATVAGDGNGTVSPEGGVSFVRGGTLTLNFGTVDGKDEWRANKITVAAGNARRSVDLTQVDWESYRFDPAASPWNQLGEASIYTINVEFKDMTNGGEQPAPKPLPDPVQIALGVSGGGQISPAGVLADGQYLYTAAPGAEQTFTLIPDAGWHLDKVWVAAGDGTPMTEVGGTAAAGQPTVKDGVLTLTPAEGTNYKVLVEFKQDTESPKVRWNVQTEVATGASTGSVTPSGTTQTQDGQVAEFSFLPADGYKLDSVKVQTTQADSFAGVEEQVMTNMVADGRLKLTINANTHVVASFVKRGGNDPVVPEKKTFTMMPAVAGAGGTISPADAQTMFVDGNLTMSFKPDRGYELAKVEVSCDDPAWSVQPKLTDMAEDNGSYSWSFGLPAGNQDRFAGKTVRVTATFQKVVTSHTVTVVTEGPEGVSASAGPDDAAGYGYVSPGYASGGQVIVAAGGSQTFYFVERAGYAVDAVYVGNTRVAGNVTSYLLAGVTADTTLRVVYAANSNSGGTNEGQMFTVHAEAGQHGAISPAPDARVPKGGSVMYTALPDDGYKVDRLTVDGVDQTDQMDGNVYTLGPVSAAHQVRVTFVKDNGGSGGGEERPVVPEKTLRHVYVNVVGTGDGMVTPGNFRKGDAQGDIEVPDGGQQTFSFLPDAEADGKANQLEYIEIKRGALVHRVEADALAAGHYTLANLHADVVLTVSFAQVDTSDPGYEPQPSYERYTVTATATEGGRVLPQVEGGATQVNAGANLTLRMAADEGFHLSYISVRALGGDGSTRFVPASQLIDGCYTLANIRDNYQVNAVFVRDGSAGEEGFTTYTVQANGAQVRASLTGVVHVKQGAAQTLTLTPTFGHKVDRVLIVDAAGRELWQHAYTGDAAKRQVDVALDFRDGVAAATVIVESSSIGATANPDAVYTVTARVAADADGNRLGTITPGGTQQFRAGSNVTFTMVPFAGCTVDSVTANGNPVVVTPTADGYWQFTATDLSGALNVVAKFRKAAEGENVPTPGKTAQVTFDVQGAGSIQPDSPALVKPGDDLTITLVPKNGAKLGTLIVGGTNVTPDAVLLSNGSYQYTIKGVTADTKVSATFVNADGTVGDTTNDLNVNVKVEVKVSGNVYGGTVDPNRTLTLTPGASQLFLVKPADGFYVADVAVEWADGRTEHPQISPWQPNYATGTLAQGGTIAAQTAQVSSIGSTAAQAGTVQKPYSYVQVDNIRQSFVLHVTLDDCLKDPANTNKDRYLYTDAANSLVTTNPDVSGNGTVTPGDNTDVVGPGGDKTLIITPGTKPDGSLEDLDSITIHGVTIDLTGDDVRDASGKQVPELVVQKVKDYTVDGKPVLRPGEDFKWVPTPAPGHYELTLKAEQDENGKWVIDQPKVDFGGAGDAFTNSILLRAFEIDAAGNRVPVDGALLKLTATRLADGKQVVNDKLQLAYGGAVRVEAELLSDEYELVGIEPDASGYVTSTPREDAHAAQPAAQADDVSAQAANTFYAYGPGSILATIQKKAATNPDDPDNPQASVYHVTATAGKGGSISAAKESYKVGEQAQFTLTPAAGFQVASITVNGQKSDYSSTTYTVPRELCVKDANITVHVEFTALVAAAGDPQTSAAKKALRSLQSLATTGDNGAPLATTLLAVAFGALGIAVLIASRRRKANADHANALDE